MTECSSCGAELAPYETRCPICGKPTAHYHRQRRCLHCGAPAAQKAKTCMMCGKPVDSLPLDTSVFSGSWLGIGLGVLIIIAIVVGVTRYQNEVNQAAAAAQRSRLTPTLIPTRTPTLTATPGPTDTAIPTATLTPTFAPTPRAHVIEAGENPSSIAILYGVEAEEILALNGIDEVQTLQVGQVLLIPASAEEPVEPESSGPPPELITYLIQAGDTLLGIALDHGTTVESITTANPDTSLDIIFPGQEIIVPLATPTVTPTPTTPPTPTATPGPPYAAPDLLSPAQGQVVDEATLLFNWTATGLLTLDEFYVLQLTWANGARTEVWVKSSSWRITKSQRPANGHITWTVTIMRQTGTNSVGEPTGINVTGSAEQRIVEWR